MEKGEKILKTGTFYWFKSQHRGQVDVPLHYLTDEQKKTLSSGLLSNRYEQCNPYQFFTAHYIWLDNNNQNRFLVTDVEISPTVKRKISPRKPAGIKSLYRITLSDMNRLLHDLESGDVDEIFVRDFLSQARWRPWVEKEWKSKRDQIIGSHCKNCGSEDKLVLQHTIQPRKINQILYHFVGERYREVELYVEQNKNGIELSFSEEVSKVPVCPKCASSQVHLRSRGPNKGTYVCNKGRNYVTCKHKFETPDLGYDEKDIKKAEKRAIAKLREKFCEEEGLLRVAARICLEEIIIYLNLTHTKTLCTKCAFKEDRPYDKYY